MTKKGIILFDIDRTILDTDKTSALHNQNVLNFLKNPDIGRIEKVKQKYRSTLSNQREYNPEDYFRLLAQEFNIQDISPLIDLYYGEGSSNIYKNSVFPGVTEVLQKLKENYNLGIYSEGTKKFQNHKFRSLGLDGYFNEDLIFIRDAKNTEEVMKELPKEAIIVDDKESICEFLTEHGFRAIWLNKIDDKVSPNFPTIHKLLDLRDIIK